MKAIYNQGVTFRVKEFYERNPYPGSGHTLLLRDAQRLSEFMKLPGRVLFPGCGTGQTMIALGKLRPELDLYGVDLSAASLEIVEQLANKYEVRVDVMEGDVTQPLSWAFKFNYIILQGTLHHVPDPLRALQNMVGHLEDNGLVFINLYGKKYHRRRLEIIEMLDLLQGTDVHDLGQRFALFRGLKEQQNNLVEALVDISPRKVWQFMGRSYQRLRNQVTKNYNSIPWTADFRELNQLWIDQFAHPYEKTYDIWETKDLLEAADLEIVDMIYLGRIKANVLPKSWQPLFKTLDPWTQRRIMELYDRRAKSIYLWAKKAQSPIE